jgi:hypothetical protein
MGENREESANFMRDETRILKYAEVTCANAVATPRGESHYDGFREEDEFQALNTTWVRYGDSS